MTDVQHRDAQRYCALRIEVTLSTLSDNVGPTLDAVRANLAERGLEPHGPAIIRYRTVRRAGAFVVEIGWIVADDVVPSPPFEIGTLPAGEYVVARHDGPYAAVGATTAEAMRWGDEQGVAFEVEPASSGDVWASWYESYPDDPTLGPDGPAGVVEICLLTHA